MLPRRLLRTLATATALAALTAVAVPADAQSGSGGDTRQQVAEVRRKRAAAAAEVDTLQANERQLQAALDALDDNVKGQEADYTNAIRRAEDAEAEAARARAVEAEKAAEVQTLADELRQVALDAYVQPPDDLETALPSSDSLTDAVMRRTLAGLQTLRVVDVLDAWDSAREDLAYQRSLAEQAAEQAERRKQDAETRLVELRQALDQQRGVLASVEDRLDRAIAEADALASLDANLSARLSREQAALAARLAAARNLSSRTLGGGSYDGSPGVDVGAVGIVEVGGVKVAASIARNVAALLDGARASGLVLGGGGYRSPAAQLSVRRSNCGSSSYAIWQMPPSRCRPPTARPGKSMHEQGLAIDFTCNGSLIRSRSNPCFRWLAANAGRFGLRNLPSEPWHWSTNGR